ncbi:hypothetical protein ACWD28_21165, partial [Streptomyces sp. NPDC002746]
MTDAIVVEGVHKRYGAKRALDGLGLAVARSTVHAVLGRVVELPSAGRRHARTLAAPAPDPGTSSTGAWGRHA